MECGLLCIVSTPTTPPHWNVHVRRDHTVYQAHVHVHCTYNIIHASMGKHITVHVYT